MEPTAFLEFARTLVALGGAVAFRTAINRAYYAAHHHAVQVLNLEEVIVPADGTRHEVVIYKLSESDCPQLHHAGVTLSALRTTRTAADYDLHSSRGETLGDARVAIGRAERIIQYLEEFRLQDRSFRLNYRQQLKEDLPPRRHF